MVKSEYLALGALGAVAAVGGFLAYRASLQARRLTFSVQRQMGLAPLTTEFVVTEQSFTIKKLAYTGTFSELSYPSYFIPGQTFPEKGLIKGKYTNTSPVPLAIKIRVIDLALSAPYNIVAEEEVTSTRNPNTTWDFWLPVAGKVVTMPNKDWPLQLQMLGYY